MLLEHRVELQRLVEHWEEESPAWNDCCRHVDRESGKDRSWKSHSRRRGDRQRLGLTAIESFRGLVR